jgi:NAD(P)H-flavin reductase
MDTLAETKLVAGSPDPMVPRLARVTGRRSEALKTWTLEIEPQPPGSDLPFEPGQFNMLYVFGTGEIPISMSGDPAKTCGSSIPSAQLARFLPP